MADTTRRVVLDLLARNRAKGEMLSFSRGMDGIYRNARRMAVGLLAAAGVGGIGYVIKQQMAVIDTTAKLSDRLGITTEALIGLQHGAQISGVEQTMLNKSLEVFITRLGEVDMGVGQAKYALDKLGLNYKELIGLSADEAFGRVADQINRLTTQAEKSAAANYLFGRSGRQLLNFFETGSAGIKRFREETEKLGLSFSRLDAAQVEAANDAMTRSKAVMTGLFRQATIELAPYIETLADRFTELATSGEGVGAKVAGVFENITLAILKAGEEVELLVIKMNRLTHPLESAKNNFDAIQAAAKRYREETGEGRRLTPGQPDLFNKIYMEERAKRGLEAGPNRESEVRAWFEGLRLQAQQRAAAIETRGAGGAKGGGDLSAALIEQEATMQEHYEKMLAMGGTYQEMQERMAVQGWQTRVDAIAMEMEAEKKAAEEAAAKEREILSARADAYRDIYGQMGKMTKSAYEAQRQILANMYEDYKKTGVPAEDLDVWYKEKLRVLSIEYMKTSGSMAEGFAAAGMTIRNEIDSWGDKAYRFSMSFRESIAGGLENSMRDFDNWKDHLLNVFEEVYWSAVRIAFLQPAAGVLASGMTAGMSAGIKALFPPAPVDTELAFMAHGGGIAGRIRERAMIPAAAFAGAKSFHRGSEEMPAWIKKNEHILTPPQMNTLVGAAAGGMGGGSGSAVIIEHRLINQGQTKMEISSVEEYVISDRRIVEVTMREMQTNLKYQRSIKQASR